MQHTFLMCRLCKTRFDLIKLRIGLHSNWKGKGALVQKSLAQAGDSHARSVHARLADI